MFSGLLFQTGRDAAGDSRGFCISKGTDDMQCEVSFPNTEKAKKDELKYHSEDLVVIEGLG